MEPTINSFSGRIVGSNNAQELSSLMSCSGQKDWLALNHPPFVIAVVSDDGAVPKEGNGGNRRGKADAGFLHRGEDAPPSILTFFREDIIEDVLQCLPLEARGSAIAEPVVNLHEGLREGRGAVALGQCKKHGGVGVDGEGGVRNRHDNPFLAPFSRETLLYLLPRLHSAFTRACDRLLDFQQAALEWCF